MFQSGFFRDDGYVVDAFAVSQTRISRTLETVFQAVPESK